MLTLAPIPDRQCRHIDSGSANQMHSSRSEAKEGAVRIPVQWYLPQAGLMPVIGSLGYAW